MKMKSKDTDNGMWSWEQCYQSTYDELRAEGWEPYSARLEAESIAFACMRDDPPLHFERWDIE